MNMDFFLIFQLSLHYPSHIGNVISCSLCFPKSCLIVWKFSFNCALHSLMYYNITYCAISLHVGRSVAVPRPVFLLSVFFYFIHCMLTLKLLARPTGELRACLTRCKLQTMLTSEVTFNAATG